MLQGSKLGRELLRLLNDMASFYPLRLAQFLTGGNTPPPNAFKICSTVILIPLITGFPTMTSGFTVILANSSEDSPEYIVSSFTLKPSPQSR